LIFAWNSFWKLNPNKAWTLEFVVWRKGKEKKPLRMRPLFLSKMIHFFFFFFPIFFFFFFLYVRRSILISCQKKLWTFFCKFIIIAYSVNLTWILCHWISRKKEVIHVQMCINFENKKFLRLKFNFPFIFRNSHLTHMEAKSKVVYVHEFMNVISFSKIFSFKNHLDLYVGLFVVDCY